MKRIHITESQLLKEEYYEAGTDFPRFYDERTDTWYEAQWNGDYGFPFGYWPVSSGEDMEFSLGDEWTTHVNACGKCAKRYYDNYMLENIEQEARDISEALENFVDNFAYYGFTYNEETDNYVSEDGSEENDIDGFTDDIVYEIYNNYIDPYDYIHNFVENYVTNGGYVPSSEEIAKQLYNPYDNRYDWTDKESINIAMEEIGMNFEEYFNMGRNEGRIWPNKEMIGFYQTEQPDPETLQYILRELSDSLNISMNELFQYHMVFEDWRNDGEVTACTISDFINGNYGPDSYEEEDEFNDEPIQYARAGKTTFVPHLANQQDKFNFFKDFRDTRDRQVYTPREKAAGNLAAYHAMRYPYGESKEKIGKIIREEINNIIKKGD